MVFIFHQLIPKLNTQVLELDSILVLRFGGNIENCSYSFQK